MLTRPVKVATLTDEESIKYITVVDGFTHDG
jgi:hypothetical protein